MTISAEERRESIIKAVQQQGTVRVADLSREFGISEVTIRNDLELLETQGLLNRVHGGAIMGNPFYGSMNLNELRGRKGLRAPKDSRAHKDSRVPKDFRVPKDLRVRRVFRPMRLLSPTSRSFSTAAQSL